MAESHTRLASQWSKELDEKESIEELASDVPRESEFVSSKEKEPEDNIYTNDPVKDDEDLTDSPSARLGPDDEIVWHYLTFGTVLPAPTHVKQTSFLAPGQIPPPECPDLSKYGNPFYWTRNRKWFMSYFGCISTGIIAYSAGAYAAAEGQITAEWHVSAPAFNVGIALFTAGFAAAPMFLAPFSELNGRRPVFIISGVCLTLFQLGCALVDNFAGMLVLRFLVGCSASTFSTMIGGVLADFYEAKDRNWAMAVFAGGAIGGTGLGPLCSGFIAQYTNWRWIFRVQAISNALLLLVIVFFFKESRGSILLSRKASAVNKWYEQLEAAGYYGVLMPTNGDEEHSPPAFFKSERIRWKVKADEERATLLKMISISLVRPFQLLFTEPVVFFFSLWITFAWSALYLLFSAIPLIFSTRYGFDVAQTGAVFSAMIVAAILSTIVAVYGERLAKAHFPEKWRPWLSTPEGRLCFACVQSFLLPIGSFWYGWTCFSDIPWIVPTLGVACATMGVFSVYLATFNYLADIYHIYASSALAAQSFCRNMTAGAFPVFVDQMFRALTYQGAGSLLGGISLVLTVVPWILVFYGPRIRARSPIARLLLEQKDGK